MSFAAAVPSASRISDDARRLCAQGLVALAAGDIAGARLYLERAAENGDARALLVLGETYDPVTLARMGALGVKGEALKARDYYAKALAAGMGAARERIAALEAQ
jgi:TPR repeat protein